MGCGASLRVTQGLMKFWLELNISRLLTELDVEQSTALLMLVRVYEVDWNELDGHEWFPYPQDTGTIINIQESSVVN